MTAVGIIVVDDHGMVRRGLRALIETHADWYVLAEASNGREAIALARQHRPDVVVMDISLPLMDGIQATRVIRRELPDTEVLALTLHDTDEVIREVLQAGAKGYLLKSDADQQVLSAVQSLALHRPYFSNRVSEALLKAFLAGEGSHAPGALTQREREIVRLIAEGNSNKDVAKLLELSVKTVETHRAAAMRKTGSRSSADLVRFAIRNNILIIGKTFE